MENKVPEHCLKLERWQGPPHTNKLKHFETVLSFEVSLFLSLFQHKKSQSMKIFHFWLKFFPENYIVVL